MTTTTRNARVDRITRETEIHLTLSVDGSGRAEIATPIPFFSHMLEVLCRHANLDVTLDVVGDVEIDQAHLIEGTGYVLGQGLREAVPDRTAIRRVGSAVAPVEEALALCAVDFAGRPLVVFTAPFARDEQDGLELDLLPDFFRALAEESRATWHLRLDAGEQEPHKVEALFKAAGRALGDAVARDPARAGVIQSTKRPRA